MRQLIGYERYQGETACARLNRIYALLHVDVNRYLPVMKLVSKEREGATVHKRYDQAKTPYGRAPEAGVVSAEQAAFEAALAKQGPLALRRQIERELDRLWEMGGAPDQTAAPASA